jgi:hypothetical protein
MTASEAESATALMRRSASQGLQGTAPGTGQIRAASALVERRHRSDGSWPTAVAVVT